MRYSPQRFVIFFTLVSAFLRPCFGLDLGDPAPPLKVVEWVKGGPIDLKERQGKSVCVVTFWDSDCSACQGALPDLVALHAKFDPQGIWLICVSREAADSLKQFVQRQGSLIKFPVASDDKGQTYDAYMTAFSRNSVPYSFVINKKGAIVWQGHPLAGLEKALEQILAGTFDIETARKVTNAENLQQEYFPLARGSNNNPAPIGNRILAEGSSNPWLLNNFAWRILTDPLIQNRDVDLALRSVKIAVASDPKNPSFFDTYARALFDAGKIKEAVEAQKQAIALCADAVRRGNFERTLTNYESRLR